MSAPTEVQQGGNLPDVSQVSTFETERPNEAFAFEMALDPLGPDRRQISFRFISSTAW